MSTTSLRRDHELIEKVIKDMQSTIQLLNDKKQISESILLPVIEESQLNELGKSRQHYEELAENLTHDVSNQGN